MFAVRLPIVVPNKVVDGIRKSVTSLAKVSSLDFCRLSTDPVFPVKVKSPGAVL